MFDFLTLSVVIDDKIFCVHGGASSFIFFDRTWGDQCTGLSPSIHYIDQIKIIDRFRGASLVAFIVLVDPTCS